MKVIRSITFEGDSVVMQYMDETDVRVEGYVYLTHQLTVATGQDYDDEIRAVEEAAQDLLRDVMEDFTTSRPYDPAVDDEDDDDDD
jgi:hypothetical protein